MKPRRKPAHPGQRLLELRHERKWSQEQVALKSGLTVRTIRNLERGVTEPDRIHPETYERLATLFGIAVEELDPRRRREWLASADVSPEQLQVIENILALPADRLDAVRKALKRLSRGKT
jgi:transcriptional regulator with XRE-family HTH domain